MQVTRQMNWTAATWPANAPATQYALFQVYPPTPTSDTPVQTVTGANTLSVQLTYDEHTAAIYQVRPTDGVLYGPVCGTFVVDTVPCRAWIRQKVRYALADQQNQVGAIINWADEEINGYIEEALSEISIRFPNETQTTITLLPPIVDAQGYSLPVREYPLPTDLYSIKSVSYLRADGTFEYYLKEKPFRGGESTATSYLGMPKLGILVTPLSGRLYPGHYEKYDGKLLIDWSPNGNGDTLNVRYLARYRIPTDDVQLIDDMPPEDMELISLRTQMKCWLRVEGQDTRLSRWREEGKRDDMPTVKMSTFVKNLYNELVNDRRETRPRVHRLMRR